MTDLNPTARATLAIAGARARYAEETGAIFELSAVEEAILTIYVAGAIGEAVAAFQADLGPLPTSPKLSPRALKLFAPFYRESPALKALLAQAQRKVSK